MSGISVSFLGVTSSRFDVRTGPPENPEAFAEWVDLDVEATDGFRVFGGEVFSFCVCTPSWLARKTTAASPIWGHKLLVVERWDIEEIETAARQLCEGLRVSDWATAITELSRYMKVDTIDSGAE
jgi:hypothetical protein